VNNQSASGGGPNHEAHTRHRYRRALFITPIPLFIIVAILLHVFGVGDSPVFDPPGLLPVLNLIFLCICPMIVGYTAARAYLKTGSASLITMGGGVFSLALGSLIAGFFFQTKGPNANITTYNVSACLAGLFHFAGAMLVLVGFQSEQDARKRRHRLIVLYSAISVFMTILIVGAYKDLLPTFFVQGQGPTLLRQVVLGVAILSFLVSGVVFTRRYQNTRSTFLYWYATALFLMAIGLGCIFDQKSFGGPTGWLGRVAQYMGGLYLVAAVFGGAKEAGVKVTQFGNVLGRFFRNKFQDLLAERTSELALANEQLHREIADHERTELSLQTAVQHWQNTFDATGDAISILGPDWRILRCNRAMLALVGKAPEAVENRPCYEIVHDLPNAADGCLLSRARESQQRERTSVQRSGRWFDVTADPIIDETGELVGVVHIMVDVTDRRTAEDARHSAENELEEQRLLTMRADRLRSLGEMAAGIAHELNQPLVGVRGSAEHLLLSVERGWDLPEEELLRKLTTVIEQADRMSKIIEHVRMFAREAGKPECRSVQVNNVAHAATELLGAQFSAHGLALECELDEELPAVWANPFSLEEVILNLLSNARDAVDQRMAGDDKEKGHVSVRTSCEDNTVRIEVTDNGTGIAEAIHDRLFEPFFTTKRAEHGTGLGLSISKSIVEDFGGTIELRSGETEGASAIVLLPAGPQPKETGA